MRVSLDPRYVHRARELLLSNAPRLQFAVSGFAVCTGRSSQEMTVKGSARTKERESERFGSCNISNTSRRNPGTTCAARRLIPDARQEAENRAILWRCRDSPARGERINGVSRVYMRDDLIIKYLPNGTSIRRVRFRSA